MDGAAGVMVAAIYDYPILIAAVLVAIGTIGKSIHWVYKFSNRIEASVSYIESEMSFNSGSTMRDAIGRIELRLAHIETNQEDTP